MTKEAVAYGSALPQVTDVANALAGNLNNSQNFDVVNGNSQFLMLGELGVLNTSLANGLQNYDASLNLSVDTSSITTPQDVLLGLINPLFGNNSFLAGNGDSLTFSYSINGGALVSYEFTSANINQLNSFFTDHTLDLGALANFVSANNTILSLTFNLDLVTQVTGAGLDVGLLLGNSTLGSGINTSAVPLPSSFWLLGSALAGLLSLGKRRKTAV